MPGLGHASRIAVLSNGSPRRYNKNGQIAKGQRDMKLDEYFHQGRQNRLEALRELLGGAFPKIDSEHLTEACERIDAALLKYSEVIIEVTYCPNKTHVGVPLNEMQDRLLRELQEATRMYRRAVGRARTDWDRKVAMLYFEKRKSAIEIMAHSHYIDLDPRREAHYKIYREGPLLSNYKPERKGPLLPKQSGIDRDWFRQDHKARAEMLAELICIGQELCKCSDVMLTKVDLYLAVIGEPWITIYKPRIHGRVTGPDILDPEPKTADIDFVTGVDRAIAEWQRWRDRVIPQSG